MHCQLQLAILFRYNFNDTFLQSDDFGVVRMTSSIASGLSSSARETQQSQAHFMFANFLVI
jgi:hypothetical protein